MRTISSTQSAANRLVSTHDLLPSERAFVGAMQQLGFGRFECLRIDSGELVLDPWPRTIRSVKFRSEEPAKSRTLPDEFQLKRQVIELLSYVREVGVGEIRILEIRHGLPFTMEVELAGGRTLAVEGDRRG